MSAIGGCFPRGWCSLPAGSAAPPCAVGPVLLTRSRCAFRVMRACGLGGKGEFSLLLTSRFILVANVKFVDVCTSQIAPGFIKC